MMRYFLMLLGFCSILLAQTPWNNPHVPCKPLAEMADREARLGKAGLREVDYPYDVNYYDLDFRIDEVQEQVYGITRIVFTSDVDGLDSLRLDFSSVMTVDTVHGSGDNFLHADDQLIIYFDTPLEAGASGEVIIEYHGHPEESGFQAFAFDHQSGQPLITTLSEPYGARTWWPCKDMPTDKADSLRVSVTVADNLIAVSNGILQSNTDNLDGTRTFLWKHDYPITTYLVSLAITDYTYWTTTYHFADGDSMPLEYWVYPSNDTDQQRELYGMTDGMIDAFNQRYGKYPFAAEKYGMAQFPWGGAMEHQTCSSMNPGSGENTIAHELAHQWWGDMVTCSNFHHIWINEGFATYSEALYYELQYGEDAYHADMAGKDYEYTGSIYRTDTTDVWSIFSYIVYGKGAWVLHMLRHVVGDDDFFQILADFREEYGFRHASTESFQAVAESVYGSDMEWFFQPWIYGVGLPKYRFWWVEDSLDQEGNSRVHLNITQFQGGAAPVYTMPVDLRITAADGEGTMVTVWDSLRNQDFYLTLPATPVEIELDPDHWILRRVQEVAALAEEPVLPLQASISGLYPNPFNGAVRIDLDLAAAFHGTLRIFNLAGRELERLPVHSATPTHLDLTWDGRDSGGVPLPAGLYLMALEDGQGILDTRKLTILK